MEFSLELLLTGVTIIATSIVTVKYLKIEIARLAKEATIMKAQVERLKESSMLHMRRQDVVDIVRAEVHPVKKELVVLTTAINKLTTSTTELDKCLAILADRERRDKLD